VGGKDRNDVLAKSLFNAKQRFSTRSEFSRADDTAKSLTFINYQRQFPDLRWVCRAFAPIGKTAGNPERRSCGRCSTNA
jgi:hypothetical protein